MCDSSHMSDGDSLRPFLFLFCLIQFLYSPEIALDSILASTSSFYRFNNLYKTLHQPCTVINNFASLSCFIKKVSLFQNEKHSISFHLHSIYRSIASILYSFLTIFHIFSFAHTIRAIWQIPSRA